MEKLLKKLKKLNKWFVISYKSEPLWIAESPEEIKARTQKYLDEIKRKENDNERSSTDKSSIFSCTKPVRGKRDPRKARE